MTSKITPETAVRFTKIITALCFTIPSKSGTTRFQVIRFKLLRLLTCVHAMILCVPMIYALFHDDYDLPRVTRLCSVVAAFLQIPWEISLLALQYDRLQYVSTAFSYLMTLRVIFLEDE